MKPIVSNPIEKKIEIAKKEEKRKNIDKGKLRSNVLSE
jgi:hypothetical protein